ncbi:hypothetical protein OY671_012963, partial [Metschnikowia pulcherrima]
QVRVAAWSARRLAHGRAHRLRPRHRPDRDDGRALPRRPDHRRPHPARAGTRQEERAGRDGGRVDPPPDAERIRRRRLPHLLQGEAPLAVRGLPAGGGRSRRRGPHRRHLLHAHAAGRGIQAPALRGSGLRGGRPRNPPARRDAP